MRPARTFAVPLLLALANLTALVAALLTAGPIHLLWSAIAAAPLMAIAVALLRR